MPTNKWHNVGRVVHWKVECAVRQSCAFPKKGDYPPRIQ
jgi:hypothetical protein